ncbi:hypothetical protein SAMN05421788_102518 [Filimonas lacunae]|uniref:Lipocalin-like domain-containing protein n=2 Tax=Filimonas lacunae TaxID=477680 RepID=A0A1N7NKH0_9BACT|nr:hypothetical protein [Filimonas lacunae]SIS98895.1 hypothetical protein SAMN05421788_102518 [Filimonas lacunae]
MRILMYGRFVLFVACLSLFLFSCKKSHSDVPEKSEKYTMIAGTWKQQDILLAVGVKLGGQSLPAGTSIIAIAPLLGSAGALFTCTKTTTYTFNADGSFAIDGCTDLLFPKAGAAGKWTLDIYDAVFKLNTEKNGDDPHWIDDISSTTLKLSCSVTIPGVGTAPLTLVLQKQ